MDDQGPASLRILLLEDSASDAQLILLQLQRDGLTTECKRVDNEPDFISALSWTPDLILSDYSLPQFGGLDALRLVKQRGMDIPFILVSGAVGEDVIVDVIKQGADDYVMKDRLARLSSAIHNALEQKRLREEKKCSDEALHVSEERYRLITQNAEDIIWTMDIKLHLTYVSPSLERALGYSGSDIMTQPFERFLAPESLASGLSALTEEMERAQLLPNPDYARVLELEYRRKDQSTFWAEMKFSFFRDANGHPSGILGVGRDITNRKRVEEDLRQAESKFRTLTEQIPPIIYLTKLGQHTGVTYISPRIKSLGFTQEEWVADPELWLRQIHPDDQGKVIADIEQSKRSGEPFKSEYRLVTRDGRTRWLIDEAFDVMDDNGIPLVCQGFMLDITERKIAEETLASRERFLEAINEMTRAILLSNNFDITMQIIANDMRKIIDADDAYILGWNEETKLPTSLATTAKLKTSFSEYPVQPEETSLVETILNEGQVRAIEDVLHSPHINSQVIIRFPVQSGIVIPLIAGGRKLGVAFVAFKSSHSFTQEEVDRAEQAGNQIALAFLEFQQNLEIQRRLKESNALNEISRSLSKTEHVGLDKVLQLIVDSALSLVRQADESVIHLLDEGKEILIPRAFAGFEAGDKTSARPSIGWKEGVAGRVIETGETINIGDIYTSDLYVHKENLPTYHSLLVAPVHSGEYNIGTISVQSNTSNAFSNSDADLLNALSNQAAIALENTHLFEATQQRLKEVDALYRTGQGLASSLDAEELFKNVVNLLQENFGYYHVQIYLLDQATGDAVLKSGSGETGARMLTAKTRLPRGIGIVNHVVETALPFFTNSVNDIMFFYRNPLLPDTQSEMTAPIKVDGKVVGVIDVQEKPPARLTDNDLRLTIAVADQLAVALQRAGLYANLQTALQQEQTVRSQLVQSERLALVGRLLASVSHELNNPLQAIQNALYLLKEEESLSSQGRQDLDVVLSEAERMAALIERLRSAYRPGRVRDFRPVDINDLIEDVHMLIATHMRHKQIVFEFHPDPDLPPVSGMSDQMRQVILNLFINAIEVMDPGGRLSVWTLSLPQQNEILVTVKDTGPGIAADILPNLFDAFVTDKKTGTGLGLTISRDIIEQHFGHIEAENDPRGGAVFKIWLPAAKEGQA